MILVYILSDTLLGAMNGCWLLLGLSKSDIMLYHMSYLCGVSASYPRVEVVPATTLACPSFHLLSFHTDYTSSPSFLTTLDILPTRKAAEEEARL
jgi:hypothetical protein